MNSYKLESGNVSGKEFAYLGHFRQQKYLAQGHNDLGDAANISGNPTSSSPGPQSDEYALLSQIQAGQPGTNGSGY